MPSGDLISRRTRSAFRDHCSSFGTNRRIRQAFENEGLDPASDEDAPEFGWDGDGERRGRFDRYTHAVNWSDPAAVRPILNVFEELLTWSSSGDEQELARHQLIAHLRHDGYVIDDDGRIRGSVASKLAEIPLEGLREPKAILEHLERISTATDADPPLAISGAKALIEATTKLVLIELGEPVDEKADLPALVKSAQKALKLHPETLAPTPAGRETVIRILSNLSQLAIGVAELRNEYGPDHGRSKPTVGLGPRHAHLAVGAASTYVRLLLETLEVRRSSESQASISSK